MSSIFYNRLSKNFKKLSSWSKQANVNCYRLYDKDIPEYPYIIDHYDSHFVVYEKGKKLSDEELNLREKKIGEIFQTLKDLFKVSESQIYFKRRFERKSGDQYTKLDDQKSSLLVNEGKLKFELNLTDYLDTGLFMDHRPLRTQFQKENLGNFLNLFSYTCSVGLAAAKGGAFTINVDLSNTYLDWGKRNYELNGIKVEDHEFIKQNVFDFLREEDEQFNTIFLDPPSFSHSKMMKGVLDIQRDHPYLITLCMNRLTDDGALYFSNNLRGFKIDEELKSKYQIFDITKKSIPADFRDPKIHQCYKISKLGN